MGVEHKPPFGLDDKEDRRPVDVRGELDEHESDGCDQS